MADEETKTSKAAPRKRAAAKASSEPPAETEAAKDGPAAPPAEPAGEPDGDTGAAPAGDTAASDGSAGEPSGAAPGPDPEALRTAGIGVGQDPLGGGGGTVPYTAADAARVPHAAARSGATPTEAPPIPPPPPTRPLVGTSDAVAGAAKIHTPGGQRHVRLLTPDPGADGGYREIDLDDPEVVSDDGQRSVVTVRRQVVQEYMPAHSRTARHHLIWSANTDVSRADLARMRHALAAQVAYQEVQ